MTSVDTYPDASWPNILGNSGGCAWKELMNVQAKEDQYSIYMKEYIQNVYSN